jgi:hypothetical protein
VLILDGKGLTQSVALTPVGNFFAGNTDGRGGVRVGVKNLDGDNRADVVVGAGAGAGSRVIGYRGSTISLGSTPAVQFEFDAFAGSLAGVYVG